MLSDSTGRPTAALGHDAVEEDGEGESDVQKSLFVGEHERAVDVCLRKERMADALVIAHVSGDVDLMRRTVQQYMRACPRCGFPSSSALCPLQRLMILCSFFLALFVVCLLFWLWQCSTRSCGGWSRRVLPRAP
jgi:hypothetical protein